MLYIGFFLSLIVLIIFAISDIHFAYAIGSYSFQEWLQYLISLTMYATILEIPLYYGGHSLDKLIKQKGSNAHGGG